MLKSLPQMMKMYGIPGISLAIVIDQQISTFECGVKNSLSQEPVTSTTVFEGASFSKPLIAYAALQLCEKGLLALDIPLNTYRANQKVNDPYLAAVTLRHVLSHTGGFSTANLQPGEPLQLDSMPGSRFSYSGEGFRYLGKVIENITGTSLASYMHSHVFIPLKMNNSSFVWEEKYDILAASPHNQKGDPLEKWKPHHAIASFSLHTTASDIVLAFVSFHQRQLSSVP
jgi:CubicO group peptidase (beta-lactamase class C family)